MGTLSSNGATATYTDTVATADRPKYTAQYLTDDGSTAIFNTTTQIFNTSTQLFSRSGSGALSITKYTL